MKILVDTHTHTIASDHAYSTVLENAAAAARAGLEGLAITDHTPPLSDAPNMMHFQNLRVIDRDIGGVAILRGAELNICDARGGLGVPDDALRNLDYCIASIHTIVYQSPDPAENLRAYQGAMEDARVKIIGHPEDGRSPVDFSALARAARDRRRAHRGQQFLPAPHHHPPQHPREHDGAFARLRRMRRLRLPGHGRPLRPPPWAALTKPSPCLTRSAFPRNWWPTLLCKNSFIS